MDGDQPAEVSVHEKRLSLCNLIRNDIHAADLRWSLFVAAAQSYRHDTILRPFPPKFLSEDTKEIDRLREVMTQMPAFPTLLSLLENPATDCSDRELLIDLLYWVLVQQDDPVLRTLTKDEFNEALSKVPGPRILKPNLIFAITYKNSSEKQKKFLELSKVHNTFWGFHGSRLENFYSILYHGLLKTLFKSGIYGNGIYLSSDSNVSLTFSPSGCGWGGSVIGSGLSCLALCEIVDHPDVVCQLPEAEASKTADDSMCGPVPQKYFVVRNSDMVQLRYLLVYGKNPHPVMRQKNSDDSMIGWFSKHKFLTFMLGYVLLLGAVGISNNPTFMRYYRMLLRRWNH